MGVRLGKGCRLHVIHTHPVNYHSNGKFFLFSIGHDNFSQKVFHSYISLDIQSAATKKVFFRHARGIGILRGVSIFYLLHHEPFEQKYARLEASWSFFFQFYFTQKLALRNKKEVLSVTSFALKTNHSNVKTTLCCLSPVSFWLKICIKLHPRKLT